MHLLYLLFWVLLLSACAYLEAFELIDAVMLQASHRPASLELVAWYLDPLGRPTVTLVRHKGSWTAQSRSPKQRQTAKTILIQSHLLYLRSKDRQYGVLWKR